MLNHETATDVTIDRGKKLVTIQWADGKLSELPYAYLRAACPCANCDTTKHGGEANPLYPEQFADITMTDVQEVGRYALRFTWSDEHDTGIYSYSYLREKSNLF
ncbi:MAG TPA: DUF971 domain-containing protein [bacterium]|nr:DUF971 domain-containing protein [bacterium]